MKYNSKMTMVEFGPNGNKIVSQEPTEPNEKKEYNMQKRLYDAYNANDIEEYKKLFESFVNDPNLGEYFTYDEGPACSHHLSVYPYCECITQDTLENNMIKVHRHNYIAKCNCKNGKYYILLHNAYNLLFRPCYSTFSITKMIKHVRNNAASKNDHDIACEIEKNNKPEIIKWIESLHYETDEFPLMLDWENCHIDALHYNNCHMCN